MDKVSTIITPNVPPMRTDDTAVFTLTFTKGLADRNRLPFEQVMRTLTEFQDLVKELGKRVQRSDGNIHPDGNFGLEVVAGPGGYAFSKGSVIANVVATQDVANAAKTFNLIITQAKTYDKKVVTDESIETAIMARRMFNMARLQQPAKSLVAFTMKSSTARAPKAVLTEKAFLHLQAARRKLMQIDGLSLYGRVRQLKDRSQKEDGDGHFWGELVTDNQDVWRLRFVADDLKKVLPLFMQQVHVTGNATYFGPAKNPRLVVTAISKDEDRDYLKAFDKIRSEGTKLFGDATTEELLKELYA